MAQELDLQVGDVVEVTRAIHRFSSFISAGDTLQVTYVIRGDYQHLPPRFEFEVLTCRRRQSLIGERQVGKWDWLVHCIRKVQTQDTPRIKEVPRDTTTPLKVGDYVEVIFSGRSEAIGEVCKVITVENREVPVEIQFPNGREALYRRGSLSLIK